MAGYLMAHGSRLLQQVSEKFHKCINYYSTRSATRVTHVSIGIPTRLQYYRHKTTFRCRRQPGRSKTMQNV